MPHPLRHILLLLLLCGIFSAPLLFSQIVAGKKYDNISFSKLRNSDFLRYGTVESIIQDDKGFMWIATNDGLARYDSYEVKIYRSNKNDPNSISHNIVSCLFKDSNGTIWAGTPKGINRYNCEQDNFHFYQRTWDEDNELSNPHVHQIAESADGRIWMVTSNGGISILDPVTNLFSTIRHSDSNENGISTNNSRSIMIDSDQNVWVGTQNHGVDVLDFKTNKWRNYKNSSSDPLSLPHNDIRTIIQDSNGEIWIGTHGGGVARFNPAENNFKIYKTNSDTTKSLASNIICTVFEDSYKNIFVCTQDGGLSLYLRESDTFHNYVNEKTNTRSISGNIVYTMYEDNAGNLWIGIFNEGLNFVDAHEKEFKIIKNNPHDENSLSYNQVFSILKDRSGILWLGTDGGGLNRYDKNGFKLLLNNKKDSLSISNNKPTCLVEDLKGNIWAGIFEGGLNCIDKNTLKAKRFFTGKTIDNQIFTTWSLLTDSNKIWVGTNSGLHTIDSKTYKTHSFPYNVSNHKGTNCEVILNIYKDSKNRILIGTTSGLNIYYPDTDKFEYFEHDPTDMTSISDNSITAIYEDTKHRIWIGTNGGGINFWNEKDNSFEKFNTNNGLINNSIFGILEDNFQNLWISTNNGLVKFNYERNSFNNYDVNDGLQGNHFLKSSFRDKDGLMYFGGINGVTYFDPNKIKVNSVVPQIAITDFKLFNKSLDINDEESPLHENIVTANSLKLNHNHSFFSFTFSALNYSIPERNKFKYKLIGFQEEWIEAHNEHSVTFTNLNPGKYKFVVTGSNNDNIWNEGGASIDIEIVPPFYKTWTFIFVIAFAIIFSALFLYYIRIKAIKLINSKLEEMVRIRTVLLEKQNFEISEQKEELRQQRDVANEQYEWIDTQHTELEMHRNNLEELILQRTKDLLEAKTKAEESDKLKSAFLANMSHEIRTPMNAIIGFINLLKEGDFSKEEELHFMSIVENSSLVLLRLIDDIIDLAKIEAGEMSVSLTNFNLHEFTSELDSIYTSRLATKEDVEFVVDCSFDNDTSLYTDYIRLNQIITNLLNNSLKFTDKGIIKLHIIQKENHIIFSVEDSGIGISQENIAKIFDRFYKIEDDNTRLYRGTGLGLAISQRLATILGGNLNAEAELGKWARFSLILPASIIGSESKPMITKKITASSSFQWENKKILIAEDEDSNYNFLEFLLKSSRVQLSRAHNGLEAVKMANANPYDLILMDIKMPLMDGHEATKSIKSTLPHLPIVAQTAHAIGAEKELCFTSGCDDYISKPIDKNALFVILEKYLG